MLWFVLIFLFLVLVYGPQFWIRHVMKKYAVDQHDLPGTGGELAQHFVQRFALEGVGVEETTMGDHYDPADRKVRLSADVFHGKSLTAIAVATHEIGHALQYARKEKITALRQRFSPVAQVIEKAAVGMLMAVPLLVVIFKIPHAAMYIAVVGVTGMLMSVLVQFIILPMEWDASFGKALPILVKGDYIQAEEYPAVKRILRAAAFTYVAATLADMLRLGRWLMILRSAIR